MGEIRRTSLLGAVTAICITASFGQNRNQVILNLGNGATKAVTQHYDKTLGPGPAQHNTSGPGKAGPGGANNDALAGLAFYTANYTSLGVKSIPMNIVGTDPSLGAATTTIPVVIVPIKMVFTNTGRTLDGTNTVPAVQNSPIFLTADYIVSPADLGVTQFGDVLQRAEFWNLPGFSQAGYHVLLGTPTVAATVTVTVPSNLGTTYNSGHFGVVSNNFFDSVIGSLFPAYPANTLSIFLTDNVFEAPDGTVNTCCTLGYHNSENGAAATAHTWIYSSYVETGTFVDDAILDVQSLSHEVAEWINDPFVGVFPGGINLIPPAILPGQGGACIINFEIADPLEAPPVVFTQVTNGTIYHLQEDVFLWWYLHGASYAANNGYSLNGTFTTPSNLCGPG